MVRQFLKIKIRTLREQTVLLIRRICSKLIRDNVTINITNLSLHSYTIRKKNHLKFLTEEASVMKNWLVSTLENDYYTNLIEYQRTLVLKSLTYPHLRENEIISFKAKIRITSIHRLLSINNYILTFQRLLTRGSFTALTLKFLKLMIILG